MSVQVRTRAWAVAESEARVPALDSGHRPLLTGWRVSCFSLRVFSSAAFWTPRPCSPPSVPPSGCLRRPSRGCHFPEHDALLPCLRWPMSSCFGDALPPQALEGGVGPLYLYRASPVPSHSGSVLSQPSWNEVLQGLQVVFVGGRSRSEDVKITYWKGKSSSMPCLRKTFISWHLVFQVPFGSTPPDDVEWLWGSPCAPKSSRAEMKLYGEAHLRRYRSVGYSTLSVLV